MKNKEKILLALFSFTFILLVYLFIVSKEIKIEEEKEVSVKEKMPVVDLVELENDYQKETKDLYAKLKTSIESNNLEKSEIDKSLLEIREALMSLTVPEDYKTFHLGLVMLVDDVLENDKEIDSGLKEIVDRMQIENNWIN